MLNNGSNTQEIDNDQTPQANRRARAAAEHSGA